MKYLFYFFWVLVYVNIHRKTRQKTFKMEKGVDVDAFLQLLYWIRFCFAGCNLVAGLIKKQKSDF